MIQYNYIFDPETRTLTPSGDPVNVKNDTNVVQIVFTMPASYEGLALSSYVWRVFYKIAMNTKLEEVRFHQFTDQTTEGENLVLTWTVTNSVTEFAGHLGFALSGTLTDTGGNVTNRINSIPAYERIEPTIGGGSYTEDDAEMEGIKDFLVGIQEAAEAAQAAAETAAAEAEASAARAEQIADELEPYKSLAIVESASGDPATFTDGSNGVPMKSVSVDIDPAQDLHGYEYPWVGGAGKNIIPTANRTQTVAGVTVSMNPTTGEITLNGTAEQNNGVVFCNSIEVAEAGIVAGTYYGKMFGNDLTGISFQVYEDNSATFTNVKGTFTLSGASNTFFRVRFANGTTFSNTKVYAMMVSGSTEPTEYSPYSNICPISGWDEVKLTRTGKNIIYGLTIADFTTWHVVNAQGEVAENANYHLSPYIKVNANADYYMCRDYCGLGDNVYYIVAFFDEKKEFISRISVNSTGTTYKAFTTPNGTHYLRFCIGRAGSYVSQVCIASGTDGTYYPQNGQTYPISLTSAGTVYGGTLDVTTGELVVDRKMVDLGSLTYTYVRTSPRNDFMATLSDAIVPVTGGDTNAICSCFGRGTFLRQTNGQFVVSDSNIASSSRVLNIRDTRYTDATSFKTAVTGQTLVYTLATPQSYTLTPTQITSLLGTNHVCADCGEVAVEYVADTKIYIDKIVASL